MDDTSTTQPGQRRIKKVKRLWNRNQGLPMNTFSGSEQSFKQYNQQQQQWTSNFGVLQHQSPASQFTSKCTSQQSTQPILPGFVSGPLYTEQTFTPLVTGSGIGSNSMTQPTSSTMISLSSSNMFGCQSTPVTSTFSTKPASPMEVIYTGLPKWSYTAAPTITATATGISTPIKSSVLGSQPQMNISQKHQPSMSVFGGVNITPLPLFGGGNITPLPLFGRQELISGVTSFGSALERGDRTDEYQQDIMRGMSFGSDAGNESDPDEGMPLVELDIKRSLEQQTPVQSSALSTVGLGNPMHYSQKRKVTDVSSDENIQSITRKGHDNDTNRKFSNQLPPEWMKSLTKSFKTHPTIIPITKINTLYSPIRQTSNKKTPTSICASSKENTTTNDSAAKLHATDISTSLAQNDNFNKVQSTEQTNSHIASTATTTSASNDIDSAKIDLPCSTDSDALTVNTQHKTSVTSLITKGTGHVASSSINPPSISILKPSPISLPPTPIITKIEHIQHRTQYNQLPDGARSTLLDAEQIISNQQAFSCNIHDTIGAFNGSNILYIKDRAFELMNDTGIMMGQLDQQMRTAVCLGMATQQQMDVTTIGKTLKNSGDMQHLFATGNHHHYFTQVFEKLQQELVELDATITKIETRVLLQQDELAPGMVTHKLGALIASQNEALLSLAAQASILHEKVQEIHQ